MREQRDALAFQRAAKLWLGEQPVDSEQGHEGCLRKVRGEATGVVEIRLIAGMGERPIGFRAVLLLEHRREAQFPVRIGGNGDRRAQTPTR